MLFWLNFGYLVSCDEDFVNLIIGISFPTCFQPRILTAMARDGLLPSLLSYINKHTKVPIKSTVVTGVGAAALAFFMDIEQLAGMVS